MPKYVLITGCDSGFGFHLARCLVSRSADLHVIACFHSQEGIDRFGSNPRTTKLVVDITIDSSVANLEREVDNLLRKSSGTLEAIVNNAGGLVGSGPVEWSNIKDDQAQMNLNFFGTVRITRALLPLLRSSRGRIILVSSVLGLVASPFGGAYSASKFALEGWSDALRREMLPFRVRVSIIEPGMFEGTAFYRRYTSSVEESWCSLPSEIKEDYGSEYKAYVIRRLAGLRDFFGEYNIEKPMRAMMHALTSSNPKYRYRVGMDSELFARILSILPTSLADIAMTLTDPLVTFDRTMVAVFPRSASVNSIQILLFAVFGYSFTWLVLPIAFIGLVAFL